MVTATALEAELLELAGSVPDPELPVLTLQELGVVRAARLDGPDTVEVDLTPTYTGCPAIEAMSLDIERVLRAHGMRRITVRTVLTPAWSTDDITPEGRRKLREFGIAPPRVRHDSGPVALPLGPTRTKGTADTEAEPVRCPHCGSSETELLSRFSSTACKALRRCLACREPFDHFKEL
ncbi:phenylacetate-CoA oxygenase subunit PaaJ [Streptomyces pluripotens]|uniref:Phenylacetate-CoA oxygenase subunit PaaJ n=1 Tax=Streptomyces pluripotens TaxID=1355015 RepID=A0A221NZQ7_9ACTN|nr:MULTISPECIES: 1,2-phenylacetyl-CoA epoxidase subunit PaaD [Streptomyces]ARP71134.1 phenylacetate-CoA oxygenase subunit PaaJ [Streptomyces pluripotens]ASN25382.1 phenylacetate-CoA oxygenase subunit PaaJ [Streptomyces pluripotens]KIE26015.1 phenylacetic acid degradation protein PaaD [Streptomyces sp. MUSC 125]MCH0557090.1 phenylacetate-CoA oxygenase subunit PaaJ [Streptomyces sp. MUM 16J]